MADFNFIKTEPVLRGRSEDKKYCVTKEDGTKYLLRISPAHQFEKRKTLFELQEKAAALGIPMCFPVAFGICGEGVYSLQSWITGEDAEVIIPLLSNGTAYDYGLEAGKILSKIHTIPPPARQEEWSARFNRKIDRQIKGYTDCPVMFEGAERLISYINANRRLLSGRPQCFQHGDYHIGNMMIDTSGAIVIIDFDRLDFGDPWEEFNRIVWCAQKSPAFASGIVNGYFGGRPPEEFFALTALYIASNTLSSIPWAISFGQDEIDTMINQSKDVLAWYDNMNTPIPSWYSENPRTQVKK